MRFTTQLSCVLVAGFVVAIVAAELTSELHGGALPLAVFLLLSAVNVVVVRRHVWNWLWLRAYARLSRALDDNDAVAAERILRRLSAESPSRRMRDWVALSLALVPILDERWADALAALRAFDRQKLSPRLQVMLDNNIAWALTHDGTLDEAVPLARSAVERARADATMPAVSRGACIGTLGVALTRAGQHEEALRHLHEALALGGPRRLQTIRYFYVGEAERALGRDQRARDAFAEAARVAPTSRFGRRAAERLESAPPGPYR